MEKQRIILTGGGTAGHITPNIALLPFLTDFEVHYVGCPNSMEEDMLKAYPEVKFHTLPSVKLERNKVLKNLAIPFKLCKAKRLAKKLLKEIKPKVIFSKGGFVALPITLAAKNIPIILHESDYSMGLANKLVVKKCRYALTSFSHLAKSLDNGICTGSPLRQNLYTGSKAAAESQSGLRGRRNLLIFGGSLGAVAINDATHDAIGELTKLYNVVHITGKSYTKKITSQNYFALPFTPNIADYFAWSDLVVSRGGANALFELAALSKPSLIIPLPKGNSRGDQVDNAEYFESLGCFHILHQENLNPHSLVEHIKLLDKDSQTLRLNMKKQQSFDGTKKIAELIKECAKENI